MEARSLAHESAYHDELQELDTETQERIKEAVHEASLMEHPTEHPKMKPLAGHMDLYRLRIGKFRAICDKHMGWLRVLKIGHREKIYREDSLEQVKFRMQQR